MLVHQFVRIRYHNNLSELLLAVRTLAIYYVLVFNNLALHKGILKEKNGKVRLCWRYIGFDLFQYRHPPCVGSKRLLYALFR